MKTHRRQSARLHHSLEALEDRIAPATFVVTNLSDNTGVSGQTSLRDAITEADAHPGSVIKFAAALHGTITLTGGELLLSASTNIIGPGSNKIIISGNGASRIFEVAAPAPNTDTPVAISGLALIAGNAGVNDGGGILSQASLTLSNVFITGCNAAFGGAVSVETTVAGSHASLINSVISGNTASASGGVLLTAQKSISISGSKILKNSSDQGAGGAYVGLPADGGSITISKSLFSGNSAAKNGGGLFLNSNNPNPASKIVVSNSTISGNTAQTTGGGIYASEGNIQLKNVSLIGNRAESGSNVFYEGGGLYSLNSTSITISGGKVEGNEGSYGGGLAFAGAFPVTISKALVAGNTASSAGGGLFSNNVSSLTIANSIFEGNTAALGGGLDLVRTVSAVISGSTISENTSAGAGGGIHVAGTVPSAVTIMSSKITGNTAVAQGGAIYSEDSATLKFSGVTVTENSASSGGGFAFIGGHFTISKSAIEFNSAKANGGGINNNATGTITTTKIKGNTADQAGGGIYDSGMVTLGVGADVSGNVAPTDPDVH